ncbi:hypothetical protein KUCAC02_001967 [Chaenocephalus aceratus]|uniref:Uncharacterized protein n=1 Tax=Chaenocephalus aceratus TaxID=36190 RepID=A0ACB9XTL2_CHAAC|nr:hypothetical protein KUCAC02_001967 [Chaenocephalus aceratus]
METVQHAKKNFSALRAEGREIEYPAKCKSVNAKDKHKEKTLCGNPEVLFTDYAQQKEGRKKNNLTSLTPSTSGKILCAANMHTYPEKASAQEAD